MSYCRFAWDGSDVYVYLGASGFECCGCRLPGRLGGFSCDSPEEMIEHLGEHRRSGHYVPRYAIEGLWEEVPGPDKPVHPEPDTLAKMREAIQGSSPASVLLEGRGLPRPEEVARMTIKDAFSGRWQTPKIENIRKGWIEMDAEYLEHIIASVVRKEREASRVAVEFPNQEERNDDGA